MKTVLSTLIFSVILHALATAAPIAHYRMDSFAFLSDAIILCDEVEIEFHEKKYPSGFISISISSSVTCRVLESFKGNLKPNRSIKLEYNSGFDRKKIGEYDFYDRSADPPTLVRADAVPLGKAVVFLKKREDEGYEVLTAKLIQDSGIYMYRQGSNPGPLVLWLQWPEFIKLDQGAPFDEVAFLEDVKLNIEASHHLTEAQPIWTFFTEYDTKQDGQQDGADQSDPAGLSVSF